MRWTVALTVACGAATAATAAVAADSTKPPAPKPVASTASAVIPSPAPLRDLEAPTPSLDAAMLAQLERQVRLGDAARALPSIDRALALHPDAARLLFLRAFAWQQLGRVDDAARAYEALTQSHPELPEPYNNLAVLRAQRGEIDQARTLLEQALRLAPADRTANENLGDVLVAAAARAYARAADGVDRRDDASRDALARKLKAAQALAPFAAPPLPAGTAKP